MTGTYPAAPAMVSPDLLRRPLRDLLGRLPVLPVNESGQPDFAAAEPDLLVELAESAELLPCIVHDGFFGNRVAPCLHGTGHREWRHRRNAYRRHRQADGRPCRSACVCAGAVVRVPSVHRRSHGRRESGR